MIHDTFFFVYFWIDDRKYTYGPYMDIEYAALMLVDILPSLVPALSSYNKFQYKAEIHECLLTTKDGWKSISTPIIENKCYRYKL